MQALAAVSKDNGQTWTTYAVPNATGFNGNEWSVVELPDGTLAGLIRTDVAGSDGSQWLTKSTDKGKTWTTPAKTNLRDESGLAWKSPAQIFLHEGKPWVVYPDKRYVSVVLATTDDPDLLDWNVEKRIPAYQYKADGTRIQDAGYPSAVYLGDGRLLVVDYYIDGGTKQIVGYYVTLPLPEPGSLAMIFVAAVGAGAYAWRRKRAAFTGFARGSSRSCRTFWRPRETVESIPDSERREPVMCRE